MKLFEIAEETILRNTIGRVISPKMMVKVLDRIFGHRFTIADVTPFVRPFNIAMQDLDTYAQNAEIAAKEAWSRLDAELSHRNKRSLPDS